MKAFRWFIFALCVIWTVTSIAAALVVSFRSKWLFPDDGLDVIAKVVFLQFAIIASLLGFLAAVAFRPKPRRSRPAFAW